MQNPVAAITGSDTTSTDNSAEAPFSPAAVMPEVSALQFSGDPGAMLAALTMATAKSEGDVARQQRDDAMSAQDKSEALEIHDMRDKANLQRVQGVVDGALQITAGLCDLGKGINEAKEVGATGSDLKDDKLRAAWLGGGSAACKAGQSVADGLFNGAITDKDADAKMHAASADAFKRMADDAHDNEKDAKELLTKALDFYKEYVDTKNQTTLAATHRA